MKGPPINRLNAHHLLLNPTNTIQQDFLIAMVFSARDPHYREPATHEALRIYALVVSIEVRAFVRASVRSFLCYQRILIVP